MTKMREVAAGEGNFPSLGGKQHLESNVGDLGHGRQRCQDRGRDVTHGVTPWDESASFPCVGRDTNRASNALGETQTGTSAIKVA